MPFLSHCRQPSWSLYQKDLSAPGFLINSNKIQGIGWTPVRSLPLISRRQSQVFRNPRWSQTPVLTAQITTEITEVTESYQVQPNRAASQLLIALLLFLQGSREWAVETLRFILQLHVNCHTSLLKGRQKLKFRNMWHSPSFTYTVSKQRAENPGAALRLPASFGFLDSKVLWLFLSARFCVS